MIIKPINSDISISDQIKISDLDELSKHGLKSIICSRPNHEVEDEHTTTAFEVRAKVLNIELHYITYPLSMQKSMPMTSVISRPLLTRPLNLCMVIAGQVCV